MLLLQYHCKHFFLGNNKLPFIIRSSCKMQCNVLLPNSCQACRKNSLWKNNWMSTIIFTQRLLVTQSQLTFPGGNFSNIFTWWLAPRQVGQIYFCAHINTALKKIFHNNVHNSRELIKLTRLTQLSNQQQCHWLLWEVG